MQQTAAGGAAPKRDKIRVTTFAGPGADPLMHEVPWPKVPPKGALIQIGACGVCGTDVKKVRKGFLEPPRDLVHALLQRRLAAARVGDVLLLQADVIDETMNYLRRFLAHNLDGRQIDLNEALEQPEPALRSRAAFYASSAVE